MGYLPQAKDNTNTITSIVIKMTLADTPLNFLSRKKLALPLAFVSDSVMSTINYGWANRVVTWASVNV